jgi:hypothetical protein
MVQQPKTQKKLQNPEWKQQARKWISQNVINQKKKKKNQQTGLLYSSTVKLFTWHLQQPKRKRIHTTYQ